MWNKRTNPPNLGQTTGNRFAVKKNLLTDKPATVNEIKKFLKDAGITYKKITKNALGGVLIIYTQQQRSGPLSALSKFYSLGWN